MNGYSKSIMVALLPTSSEWCKIPLPHLTVVYAGETDGVILSLYNELAKQALLVARQQRPITLNVLGVAEFGEDEKVDVLTLDPTEELLKIRKRFSGYDVSVFDVYSPHVTVGPAGSIDVAPDSITFDRICVAWGIEMLTYLFPSG